MLTNNGTDLRLCSFFSDQPIDVSDPRTSGPPLTALDVSEICLSVVE